MTTPAPAPYVSASLYVGDLNNDVTEALLFEIFNDVGPVASVRVCRDAATRRSLGYAYVNFHRVEDAEKALDIKNFSIIRNRPCRIMWSHRDPSLRRSGVGNIFVKNLAKSVDNKSLYDTFSMFGNILSCKVATNAKKESLGYAFVHYESGEAAEYAIQRVDGKVISGEKVSVQPFKSKTERNVGGKTTFTNLYVKNLPDDFNTDKLQAMFQPFGKIASSFLQLDDEKKPLGFGFVCFESPDSAVNAIGALHDKEVEGKKLFVSRAQKKEERQKEMLERFESLKLERQKKYAGVNLFVKNLSEDHDDDKLRETFAPYGSITSARIMRDAAKKSKGFGFVCFSTPEEATKAVTELNGKMVDGKPLYVSLAQRKEHRRAHLEAQYSARKNGAPQQMFAAPPGPQMFYHQGMGGPQRYAFPPQMIGGPNRGFMRGPGAPPMMGVPGGVPPSRFQLMPAQLQRPQGQPGGGGEPARGRRRNQQGTAPMQQTGAPRQQQVGGQRRQQASGETGGAPEILTIKALAAAPEDQKKQMIGERLFPLIQQRQPESAGKITGMLLEMDNGELLHLLESPAALDEKVQEAVEVLELAMREGSTA